MATRNHSDDSDEAPESLTETIIYGGLIGGILILVLSGLAYIYWYATPDRLRMLAEHLEQLPWKLK